MSVYNGASHLAESIESILVQSFRDFEFLILNDGSVDGSQEIIDGYAARDSRIRAIHRDNRGLIASLNELIASANAPLIARMDDDDIAMPQRFAEQYAFLKANPDHGVVGGWTIDIDETGGPAPVDGQDHPVTNDDILRHIRQRRNILCHPLVMMRRDVVRSVGGYHRAFRHCEDYDLWLRLSDRTKMANLPIRLLKYRRSADQVSSRHALTQQIGAAISYLAHLERVAGRPDPTTALEDLPPLEHLDDMFGRSGVPGEVRAIVVPGILYSESALRGDGLAMILQFLADGKKTEGLYHTAARLMLMGEPVRAARLALALARA